MKHKIIFITILTLLIALYGYAQTGITIKPYLGYSTVSMSDFNKYIDAFSAFPGAQVDLLDHALLGGVQLGYDVLNDPSIGTLNIGVGTYYLYVFPGRIKISLVLFVPVTTETTFNASLIPLLGNITYTYNIDPIYLGANASVGYGFSSFSTTTRSESQGQVTNTTESYSGNGLVAEGKLIIGFNIIKELSVELNVGYRYAPIGEIKPPNQDPIKTDFSGIIATLGANIRL